MRFNVIKQKKTVAKCQSALIFYTIADVNAFEKNTSFFFTSEQSERKRNGVATDCEKHNRFRNRLD